MYDVFGNGWSRGATMPVAEARKADLRPQRVQMVSEPEVGGTMENSKGGEFKPIKPEHHA